MDSLHKRLKVVERDINLLLLEELNVNAHFAAWLLKCTAPQNSDSPRCSGAWYSISHSLLDESDLVVQYDHGLALLLDNNIDTTSDPDQAKHYKELGLEGYEQGYWDMFLTCIIAPEHQLQSNAGAVHYDRQISYESIRDWLLAQHTTRATYRAGVISDAIQACLTATDIPQPNTQATSL